VAFFSVPLCSPPFVTASFQVPSGRSPQKWTDMKAQFEKPIFDLSLLLFVNSCDSVPNNKSLHFLLDCIILVIPDGEVRNICNRPRSSCVIDRITIACSKVAILEFSTSTLTVVFFFGSKLMVLIQIRVVYTLRLIIKILKKIGIFSLTEN
jgi:hypothetical protein